MYSARKLFVFISLAISLLVYTSTISANTFELFNASFTDGTSVTGEFGFNVYGNLSLVNISTEADGNFTAIDYTSAANSGVTSDSIVIFDTYSRSLHVVFENPLNSLGENLINTSASYECLGYTCPPSSSTQIRYFASGFAAVPEPQLISLFLVGLCTLFYQVKKMRFLKTVQTAG
jgi:hypothetical protein